MEVVETSKNLPPLLLAYDSWIPSENTQIEKKNRPCVYVNRDFVWIINEISIWRCCYIDTFKNVVCNAEIRNLGKNVLSFLANMVIFTMNYHFYHLLDESSSNFVVKFS